MTQNNNRQGNNPKSFPSTDKDLLRKIITDDGAAKEMVEVAECLGKALAKTLTTSQIRSLFTEVRRIQADWLQNPARAQRRLILLKPKMQYRAKKESGEAVKKLVSELEPALDMVEGKPENFQRFAEFFEAILAYHKAYGGN